MRTEKHGLVCVGSAHADLLRTVLDYRRLVRVLAGVILVNFPALAASQQTMLDIEHMFHVTVDNPKPRYALIDRMFPKFPSYLRRAAINAAFGAVSSYLSNYRRWQAGMRSKRTNKPPMFAKALEVNPPLYGGNCLTHDDDWKTVRIKVLREDGTWGWTDPLKLRGKLIRLHGDDAHEALSPSLIVTDKKAHLGCPVKVARQRWPGGDIVCGVDLGINTAATCAIVDSVGTVRARRSIRTARHNDLLDRAATKIRQAAEKTLGPLVKNKETKKFERPGKLSKGFCRELYARIKGLNQAAAQEAANAIVAFARENGATTVVFERLKGWRPKGPRQNLRQKFNRWLHRMLVKKVTYQCEEQAIKVAYVNPRGTSAWAHDGSGEVTRDKKNYSLCTFASGKRYNADQNAALNIAARFIAQMLGVTTGDRPAVESGKSSDSTSRMPIVLADIWAHACESSASGIEEN